MDKLQSVEASLTSVAMVSTSSKSYAKLTFLDLTIVTASKTAA